MAKKTRKKAKPAKAAKSKRKPVKAKITKKAKKKAPAKAAKAKRAVAKKAKRPVAKKAKRAKTKARPRSKDVIGEGNYTASRNFDKKEAAFVKKNKKNIPAMGKAAEAALDGPEGAELIRAEESTAGHAHE